MRIILSVILKREESGLNTSSVKHILKWSYKSKTEVSLRPLQNVFAEKKSTLGRGGKCPLPNMDLSHLEV